MNAGLRMPLILLAPFLGGALVWPLAVWVTR